MSGKTVCLLENRPFVIRRRQVHVACGTGTNHSGAGECNLVRQQ